MRLQVPKDVKGRLGQAAVLVTALSMNSFDEPAVVSSVTLPRRK